VSSEGPEPDRAEPGGAEQLALLREQVRRSRTRPPEGLAEADPVARVVVDVGLPHLDRTFDYAVPASMADTARPGVRVRVRFAGQQVDGWVVARTATSDSQRALARLGRVVSPDPVLTPEVLALARAVADRYAGTLPDVLRSAVPPRHAATEAKLLASLSTSAASADESGPADPPGASDPSPGADGWDRYQRGGALVQALQHPGATPPRVAWTALPGEDWAAALARLAAVTAAAGRSTLLVAPDARDVRRLDGALTSALGPDRHVLLTADLAPAARYAAFLRARHGAVRVVAGTRAAVFAPLPDLGLLALWDDGDDSLADPRAPYWHAREVLSLRSQQSGIPLVVGSYARSVDVARSVRTGWLTSLHASRAVVRQAAPRVVPAGGGSASDAELARDPAARSARLPHTAFEVTRDALTRGPVLVQVPRRGYLPGLACARCRAPARCGSCSGPLALAAGTRTPQCRWCGRLATDWRCPQCGFDRYRATATGVRRTAEELGLAFRGVPVLTSGRDPGRGGVLDVVAARPTLVVATTGAEPRAEGGYAGALLLDGRLLLERPDLRAAEEAARRWFNAAALVRPAPEGGTVVLVAEADLPVTQALVRWDPAGLADRELDERAAAGLPPAARVAELVGAADDVDDLLARTALPASARVLGPVPWTDPESRRPAEPEPDSPVRALVTLPAVDGAALARELRAAAGVRSARKVGGPVTVRLDPVPLR
jgi:primosomal protein N' (replication factor Y)